MQLMDQTREAKNNGDYDGAIGHLEEALTIEPDVDSVMAQLARLYFQKQNYAMAADYALRFLEINPGQNKYIYLASHCFKRLEEYGRGAELGEKLFLRDPHNMDNIINLVAIYIKMERWGRAREVLDAGFELEPENKEIHKLKTFLEQEGRV